jgi:hypothetical protein
VDPRFQNDDFYQHFDFSGHIWPKNIHIQRQFLKSRMKRKPMYVSVLLLAQVPFSSLALTFHSILWITFDLGLA